MSMDNRAMVGLLFATIPLNLALPSHAMRLDGVLRLLASASSEAYSVSETMRARIVLLTGPARPEANVRADLAAATWGRWRHSELGWRLEEDRDAIAAWQKDRLAKRVVAIKKAQEAMRTAPALPLNLDRAKALKVSLDRYDRVSGNTNGRYQAWQKLTGQMPTAIAVRRVVASIDPVELAAIDKGRVVYSDRPTRLQRALPDSASTALRDMERDQNEWAKVNVGQGDWPPPGKVVMAADPRLATEPIAKGGLRLVLRVNSGTGGDLELTALFVDARRRNVGWANLQIPCGETPPKIGEVASDDKESFISFSDVALEHARAMAGKSSAAMRQMIGMPKEKEPLDFYAGDALRGLSGAKAKPLVAWIPDTLIWPEERAAQTSRLGQLRPSEWIQQMGDLGTRTIESDDRIIVRPDPTAMNVERADLETLLAATDQQGRPPFDGLADYAARYPSDSMDKLCQVSLDTLYPGASGLSQSPWPTLSLWGCLTAPQRSALRKGGAISWTALQVPQQEKLTQAILAGGEIERQGLPVSRISLDDEPTEILAGPVSALGLEGYTQEEDGLLVRDGTVASAYDLTTLAMGVYRREKGADEHPKDGLPEITPTEFVPGKLLGYGFTVRLTRELFWSAKGRYADFDLRANAVGSSELPSEVRARYEGILSGIRKDPPPGP